jgi:hypothetical protein
MPATADSHPEEQDVIEEARPREAKFPVTRYLALK